jgi:Kef-type K+ transport system membrane component KefB
MESLAHKEVINLLLQLAAMLLAARLFAEIAQKLNQPAVVGEIIAGIVLGPTIMGMISPDSFHFLFQSNPAANLALDGIIQMAVILLLFIAGLEVELHLVWSQGKSAINISLLGLIVPFILGFVIPYFLPDFFGLAERQAALFPVHGYGDVDYRLTSGGADPDGHESLQDQDGDGDRGRSDGQ